MPVPVLDGRGFVRGGHLQVGHDERVAIHRVEVGQGGQGQRPLVGVQGAAALGAGVGRDLPGVDVQAHPADQQSGRRRPPVRAVVSDRDLRAGHVARVGPLRFCQAREQSPQGRDALGADGELDTGQVRGPGQRPGEVAGVGGQPDPPDP
ncbi:MAG: hypothetical protein ACRDRO_29110, partial [Pseudonocardiaceae bacterium]